MAGRKARFFSSTMTSSPHRKGWWTSSRIRTAWPRSRTTRSWCGVTGARTVTRSREPLRLPVIWRRKSWPRRRKRRTMLEDGLHGVPAGYTASVVTHLEMKSRPEQRAEAALDLELIRVPDPDPAWYLELFRKVGAPWLWFGRLTMQKTDLLDLLRDPKVHVHALRAGDEDVGLLELDFRQAGECELAYFGLTTGMVGTGTGRWLMNRAIPCAYLHIGSPVSLGFLSPQRVRALQARDRNRA